MAGSWRRLGGIRWWLAGVVVALCAAAGGRVHSQSPSNRVQAPGLDLEALQTQMRAQERVTAIEQNRQPFIASLIAQWAGEASGLGYDDGWTDDMLTALASVDGARLLGLSQLRLMEARRLINSGFRSRPAVPGAAADLQPLTIGDGDTDLVYFPLTPCRIFDTRTVGSAMGADSERNFVVNGTLTGQGGNPAGCGVPSDPAAVALTLTAVGPDTTGNLRAFAFGGSAPFASVLNYSSGQIIANTTIVPVCQLCGSDIRLRADTATVHVVGDVVGYFWSPIATPVDVSTLSVAAGVGTGIAFSFVTPSCPAGRSLTGGGCAISSFNGTTISTSAPSAGAWLCAGRNDSGGLVTITVTAFCARVPGR